MNAKKWISIILSLVMLTVFIPKNFTNAATNYLSINKSSLLVLEKGTVTVTGLAQDKIEDMGAWIGVYNAGDKAIGASDLSASYVNDLSDGKSWTFEAPNKLGNYQIRLYWRENGTEYLAEALDFKVVSNPAKTGDLSLSGDKFLINDKVKLVVTGLSSGQIAQGAWAGLFMKGDMIKANSLMGAYISDLADGKTWEFAVPNKLGDYEIRVFTQNVVSDELEGVLFGKLSFSVVSNPAKNGDLSISSDRFLVNDKIKVTITGLTKGQIENGAFAGIYLVSDDLETDSLGYSYISDLRDGKTWEFTAPNKYGKYEVRVFTMNVYKDQLKNVLFGRLPFIVGSNPAKKGDIRLDKEAYKMNEKVTVTIQGVTPGQIADGAWVGVFKPDDDYKTDALTYQYLSDRRDGKTWSFNAPSDPGVYEIRVFTSNVNAELRELAFFGRVPFTVLKQSITAIDNGAFSWNDYTMKVTPNKQVTVTRGKTFKVKVTAERRGFAPVPANVLAKYKIADTRIATVDRTGVVKGAAKGTTALVITGGKNKVVLKIIVK